MMDAYLGQVTPWAGNYAPVNWQFCQGQPLSINGNEALFMLIGSTFGGNGASTFNLPDLRGRVAIHAGQGVGRKNYTFATSGGAEQQDILPDQIPEHNHTLTFSLTEMPCAPTQGTQSTPANHYPAAAALNIYASEANEIIELSPVAYTPLSGGAYKVPLSTVSPYLAMNYIICTNGLFPPNPNS